MRHPGQNGTSLQRFARAIDSQARRPGAALVGFVDPSGPPGQDREIGWPSAGLSSGSGVFPASSLAFDRRRPGLRGFPGTRAAHRPEPVGGSPRGLHVPFRALDDCGNGSRRPASRGIRRMCPSVGIPVARPLPGAEAPIGLVGPTHRVAFRPRGSSPPRRFPPRGGRGSIAPRSRTRVRRVSRCTGARLPQPPEDGPGPGHSQWRSPRRGSHPSKSSLRRQPHRITAAVASLPSPSRPRRAGRRLDSMKLRSAEADPHVTECVGPTRRRSDTGPPHRTSTVGAAPGGEAWAGRSDQRRGGRPGRSCEEPPTPEGIGGSRAAEATRRSRGSMQRAPKRARCGSVESSQSGSASRPCSVDEVRCRQTAVASGRRSFLPWALFPFEVHPCFRSAIRIGPEPMSARRCHRGGVAVRQCLAGADPRPEPRERIRGPARPKAARSGGSPESLCGFTRRTRPPKRKRPSDEPKPIATATRGEPEPDRDRRLFSAATAAPVSRPRTRSRPKPEGETEPVPGESVRSTGREVLIRDARLPRRAAEATNRWEEGPAGRPHRPP
jgi:hypothetical protein